MSKGLVCLGHDVVPARSGDRPVCRTEFRLFGAFVDDRAAGSEGTDLHLSLSYVDDVGSTWLLAGALSSTDPSLRSLGDDYRRDVEQFVAGLPAELRAYFAGNFYEATGDADDPMVHAKLPIVRARSAARAALDVTIPRRYVEDHCRRLLTRHVGRVLAHFGVSGTGPMTHMGLSLPLPVKLRARVDDVAFRIGSACCWDR